MGLVSPVLRYLITAQGMADRFDMGSHSRRPEILILHARGDWYGLPRIPEVCRDAGARVTIFAPPTSELWKASFIDERIAAPAIAGEFSRALREHLEQNPGRYAWVLVGDENAVIELAENQDKSWLRGWFPVDPDGPAVQIIHSKTDFTAAAAKAGLPVPGSKTCNDHREVVEAAESFGYPVMLKAEHGFGGTGVGRANSSAELEQLFGTLADRLPLVVQKFEVGRVGSTQILFNRGQLVCWASSYKVDVFPEPYGPSSAREFMVHPDFQEILNGVGRLTGFHGLCAIDWIQRDSDKSISIIEFNPRPAPLVHLGHCSGVSFSAAIADMLAGRFELRPPRDMGARTVYLFPQNLARCIEGRYWKDLLAHWTPGLCRHDVPWNQPGLLWSQTRALLKRLKRVLAADISRTFKARSQGRNAQAVGLGKPV
jgi:hypothetical protein